MDPWNDDTYFVFGDPQAFSDDATRADDYVKIAQWICSNRTAFDIVGMVNVGDNVQDGGVLAHFNNVDPMFDTLDGCAMPYTITYGNHDGSPVVQDGDAAQNATNYQAQLGARVYSKWWVLERGDYILSKYTTNLEPRSYSADMAGPLMFVSGEWGVYDGLNFNNVNHPANRWVGRAISKYPQRMTVVLSHESPCFNNSCSIAFQTFYSGWARQYNHLVAALNGHWNALSCATGWGYFATGTGAQLGRTNPYLVGGVDHSCTTRAYNATAYGWNALLQWHRASRSLCLRTIRVINASTTPATILGTPDFDRTDGSNDPETCIVVPPLR